MIQLFVASLEMEIGLRLIELHHQGGLHIYWMKYMKYRNACAMPCTTSWCSFTVLYVILYLNRSAMVTVKWTKNTLVLNYKTVI